MTSAGPDGCHTNSSHDDKECTVERNVARVYRQGEGCAGQGFLGEGSAGQGIIGEGYAGMGREGSGGERQGKSLLGRDCSR